MGKGIDRIDGSMIGKQGTGVFIDIALPHEKDA